MSSWMPAQSEVTKPSNPQVLQHLRTQTVIPQVRTESQRLVRLDGVEAPVLQRIRFQFVHQSDSSALVSDVNKAAAALFA